MEQLKQNIFNDIVSKDVNKRMSRLSALKLPNRIEQVEAIIELAVAVVEDLT